MVSSNHFRSNEAHRAWTWEYADATARAAATGFVSGAAPTGDVGRWAKQLSDGTLWEIASVNVSTTANWTQVNGVISGPTGVNISATDGSFSAAAQQIKFNSTEMAATNNGDGSTTLRPRRLSATVIPPTASVSSMPSHLMACMRAGAGVYLTTLGAGSIPGSQIGGIIDASPESSAWAAVINLGFCAAVKFDNTIWVVKSTATTNHKVYKRDPATGNWTLSDTQTFNVQSTNRTGLFVVSRGTTQRLGYVFCNQAANALIYRYTDDGTTWASSAAVATSIGNNYVTASSFVIVRGCAYFVIWDASGNSKIVTVDCMAASITISSNYANLQNAAIVSLYGRIFLFAPGYGSFAALQEFTSGTIVNIGASVQHISNPTTATSYQPLLFAISTTRLVLWYLTSGFGSNSLYYFRCAVFDFTSSTDTNPTVTQYDSCIPTTYQLANANANNYLAGFWVNQENVLNPGDSPQNQIYSAANSTANMSTCKWLGVSSTHTLTTIGSSVQLYDWPFKKTGGGEYMGTVDADECYWSAGYPYLGPGDGTGQKKIYGKIQSTTTTRTYTGEVYVGTAEYPQGAKCVLTGTATGCTRATNDLTGIAHNTAFSVNIDITGTGVSPSAPVWFWVVLTPEL